MQVAPHSDKWSLTAATKCCHTFLQVFLVVTILYASRWSLCILVVTFASANYIVHCHLREYFSTKPPNFSGQKFPRSIQQSKTLNWTGLTKNLWRIRSPFFSTKYGFSNDLFKLLKFWCCRKKSPYLEFPAVAGEISINWRFPLKTSPATHCIKKNGTNS